MIATRADPPLPLASLRADGDLLEVRAADLRFTADEAAAYLNDAMDLRAHRRPTSTCSKRAPRGGSPPCSSPRCRCRAATTRRSFIAEFAGDDRFILDYLADEVLERQTAEVRDFLLDTSILSRLTGPLCAAVTGQRRRQGDPRASSIGRTCSSSPLDDRRTWYRYHHLFGDVAAGAARSTSSPTGSPSCTAGRATGTPATASPHEAIAHALAGDDPSGRPS